MNRERPELGSFDDDDRMFFRKLLKRVRGTCGVIVTDELGSHQVTHREMIACLNHRHSKYLNNRIEKLRVHRISGSAGIG